MKKTKIPFNETGLFSKLICDLSNADLDFNTDHDFIFDLNTIKESIKKHKKNNTSILRDVIKEQYQKTSFLNSNFKSVNKFISKLIELEGKVYLAKDSILDKNQFRERCTQILINLKRLLKK